jgi:hypothetical protein
MQDMVGGDNNRTPVKFEIPDNCNIVGGIWIKKDTHEKRLGVHCLSSLKLPY